MKESLQHYFDAVLVLAQKDFKTRYRNSALGFVWALLNPLAYMVILTAVFSQLLHSSVSDYAPWLLIALLIWRFFSVGTSQGLISILANPSLVNRVYFPRILIVLSNNLANLCGSALEFAVLLPVLVLLGTNLTLYALFLPAVLILEFVLIFGISLCLASLNVNYRDFYQIWDIALQLGFFLSPIIYSDRLIPQRYSLLYSLNPVTRLISIARDILLYNQMPLPSDTIIFLAALLVFLLIGYTVFHIYERGFAEEI